jgi:excisionase family DNA binding protein
MEQLMTLAQVAEILQVSTRTVFRLIERGELAGAKVGREWRFTREDLETYLHKARGGGADVRPS